MTIKNKEGGVDSDAAFFDQSIQWSKWFWIAGFVFPVFAVPIWVGIGNSISPTATRLSSATSCILILALTVSAYTDIRWRLIPNWVTYPAILLGLGMNLFDNLTHFRWSEILGTVGIADSLLGFIALFVGLLLVFSISGGGAGDVKLVGAIGALLGFVRGAEAVCLSFVLCAVLVLCWSLLQMGPLRIIGAVIRKVGHYIFYDWVKEPGEDQKKLLKTAVPLGPFFAMGTFLVIARDTLETNPQPFQFLTFG